MKIDLSKASFATLPENKKREFDELQRYTVWVYGKPLAGKTYFADTFEDVLFLNTDSNMNYVTSPFLTIESYRDMLKVKELLFNDKTYKTIVFDLIEDFFTKCRNYILKKHNITHESELAYGQGWGLVQDLFLRYIGEIVTLKKNIIFLSHETEIVETKKLVTRTILLPNIKRKVFDKVSGFFDFIIHAEKEESFENGKLKVDYKLHINNQDNSIIGIRPPLKNTQLIISCENNFAAFVKILNENIDFELLKKSEVLEQDFSKLKVTEKKVAQKKEELKDLVTKPKKKEKEVAGPSKQIQDKKPATSEKAKIDSEEDDYEDEVVEKKLETKTEIPEKYKNVKFIGGLTYEEVLEKSKQHGIDIERFIK